MYDYEMLVFNSIQQFQHTWIKKARGLGITELILRYLAWACLSTDELHHKSIFIVSGTREEFANKLKERLESLFARKFPRLQFDSKYTELMLNKTWIKVFPTKSLQVLRGYAEASYIFLDEADYFDRTEVDELEATIASYEEKSKGKIIMVSTPYKPEGLFEQVEHNKIFKDKFNKIFLDYRHGLDKIYDNEFIEKEKDKEYFEREYDLKYVGKIGNVYSHVSINAAVKLGEEYNPLMINRLTPKVMAIDEGFSSSKFAIVVGQYVKGDKRMEIIHAEELDHPSYEDAIDHIFKLREKYGNVLNILFDGSRPELGVSIKKRIGENYNWNYVQEKVKWCKTHNIHIATKMIVAPIVFHTESKSIMTYHSRQLLDDTRGRIAINKKMDKLIVALKAAIFDDEGKLNKQESPYNDLLDAFQMLCTCIYYKDSKVNQGDYNQIMMN